MENKKLKGDSYGKKNMKEWALKCDEFLSSKNINDLEWFS